MKLVVEWLDSKRDIGILESLGTPLVKTMVDFRGVQKNEPVELMQCLVM